MIGMCHICGGQEKLTFEHIPPKRAFNSYPIAIRTIRGLMQQNEHGLDQAPLQKLRKGMGRDSLCEKCNGWTAQQYGNAFADFAVQALRYKDRVDSDGKLAVPFDIEPLRVIKQIIVMSLATAEFDDPRLHETLRRLVIYPFERHIPPLYQFDVYFNLGAPNDSRMVTNAMMCELGKGVRSYSLAEVAFPPMGYSLTTVQQGLGHYASEIGLCNINHFAESHLDERKVLWLAIPARFPAGPAPLAFKN
jgi:hypothetical protein